VLCPSIKAVQLEITTTVPNFKPMGSSMMWLEQTLNISAFTIASRVMSLSGRRTGPDVPVLENVGV
jgi:hypothetical protein